MTEKSNTTPTDVRGKTVLLTGGTSGIGKEAATEIARRGATVLVTGRNRSKGEAAVEEIRRRSANEAVDLLVSDFASQDDVRQLAQAVSDRFDRLDVLINNVGLGRFERHVTEDGIEMTFAVNYVSHYLLTNLLLPVLEAAPSARIINVSSGLHADGELDFDDLHRSRSYDGWEAYRQSKLAMVLFTYELARRLEETDVTVNCLEPGFVPGTSLFRDTPWYYRVGFWLLDLLPGQFVRTTGKAAETYVYLASSPEVADVTGRYFLDSRPTRSAPQSYDKEAQRRLWDVSIELASL